MRKTKSTSHRVPDIHSGSLEARYQIRAGRLFTSKCGGPGGIRTHDSRIKSPELYR